MDGYHQGLRLPNFDYSTPGAYFLTVCTHLKRHTLSEIRNGVVFLHPCGEIVERHLQNAVNNHPLAMLDSYVIMPNHVHLLLVVLEEEMEKVVARAKQEWEKKQAGQDPPLRPRRLSDAEASLKIVPSVMKEFKSRSTREANLLKLNGNEPLWQRNYYDRIIRNPNERHSIQRYIANNPLAWDTDEYNT